MTIHFTRISEFRYSLHIFKSASNSFHFYCWVWQSYSHWFVNFVIHFAFIVVFDNSFHINFIDKLVIHFIFIDKLAIYLHICGLSHEQYFSSDEEDSEFDNFSEFHVRSSNLHSSLPNSPNETIMWNGFADQCLWN